MKNLITLKKKLTTAPISDKTSFEYKMLFVSIIPPHYSTTLNVFASNS